MRTGTEVPSPRGERRSARLGGRALDRVFGARGICGGSAVNSVAYSDALREVGVGERWAQGKWQPVVLEHDDHAVE